MSLRLGVIQVGAALARPSRSTLSFLALCSQPKGSLQAGHSGKPDLHLTADSRTWARFLAKEAGILPALLTRKFKLKGSPKSLIIHRNSKIV
jgi:putative sterol carrier protein